MFWKLLKAIFYSILLAVICGVAYLGYPFVYPDISYLKTENPEKTAFMEMRERQWAAKGKNKKIKQKWVPLKRISPYLVDAVLIAEDDKFWNHSGFDIEGIETAMKKNLKAGKITAGGSTITQQLAKNLFLSSEKSIVRKIREAIYAYRLEEEIGKQRILEIYLNVAEWGDGIFGIEAAARRYYRKSAISLDPTEAAHLAAVLPNPRKYSPTGNSDYVANSSYRIYSIMLKRDASISAYDDYL